MNVEILNNNVYFSFFNILNILLSNQTCSLFAKRILLIIIKMRQFDGNVEIFDFMLKKLRIYVNELVKYEETDLENHKKMVENCKNERLVLKKYQRINY